MLPESAIIQFKKIYKSLYKVDLTDEEARLGAEDLLAKYRAVYSNRPSPYQDKQLNSNNAGENNIQSQNNK
ncbi:MAG: hypothetical protein WC242_00025 [Candidatus Paceibacterota bacterium]|jgi:hypothetical protein